MFGSAVITTALEDCLSGKYAIRPESLYNFFEFLGNFNQIKVTCGIKIRKLKQSNKTSGMRVLSFFGVIHGLKLLPPVWDSPLSPIRNSP